MRRWIWRLASTACKVCPKFSINQEYLMSALHSLSSLHSLQFNRFARLASVVVVAGVLSACNTPPRMGMPMGMTAGGSMAHPEQMARMDAQMKSMEAVHEKMRSAKTSAERNALMAEHMKTMQGGMAMMDGMGDMTGTHGAPAAPSMGGGTGAPHQMMEKRMQMMQMMLKMMMDRMPPAPAK
jgi:hypothetical protein